MSKSVTQESWVADAIQVTVSGVFNTRHTLEVEAGSLGELTYFPFRSSGVFQAADGRELAMRKTNWWRRWYELREGETVLGNARPRGFFRREIMVQFKDQKYMLKPASFWNRCWYLTNNEGAMLLEVCPRGFFRRGAYLTILDTVDVALLVFTYYLVHMRWQEQSAAVAAAS
jgi:hypothetical protein